MQNKKPGDSRLVDVYIELKRCDYTSEMMGLFIGPISFNPVKLAENEVVCGLVPGYIEM